MLTPVRFGQLSGYYRQEAYIARRHLEMAAANVSQNTGASFEIRLDDNSCVMTVGGAGITKAPREKCFTVTANHEKPEMAQMAEGSLKFLLTNPTDLLATPRFYFQDRSAPKPVAVPIEVAVPMLAPPRKTAVSSAPTVPASTASQVKLDTRTTDTASQASDELNLLMPTDSSYPLPAWTQALNYMRGWGRYLYELGVGNN